MSRALYKQLTDDFLEKISTGAIKVGERLPPEDDYAEQLGVSRSTLRLSFAQLEKSGIIKRRKRGGTEVIADRPIKKYNMVGDFLHIGPDTYFEISDVYRVEAEEVEDLAEYLDIAGKWLCVVGCRYLKGEDKAYALAVMYIPERYSDIDLSIGVRCDAIFKYIEDRYSLNVGRMYHSMNAVLCPEKVTEHLDVQESDPLLSVLGEFEDSEGHLIEIVIMYYDTKRIDLNSVIKLNSV